MKHLIAGAVAGLCFTGAAYAMSAYDADRIVMIRTAKATGITFVANSPTCKSHPLLMGAFVPDGGELHLCFDNMKPYGEDPDNVVKHELIHAAQVCKGGVINKGRPYQLTEALPADAYPPEIQAIEIEARALAQVLSFGEVARLLVTHCH